MPQGRRQEGKKHAGSQRLLQAPGIERSDRQTLVAACDKYLSDHPGTVFYAAETVSDLDPPVNDRDRHVGLHAILMIFDDRAAHDVCQDTRKHLKSIGENKDTWAKLRVFDTSAKGDKK